MGSDESGGRTGGVDGNEPIYDVSSPPADSADIGADATGAKPIDEEFAALLPGLFATALKDEPAATVTPLTVVRAARAEQRAAAVRRWAPGALVAAAATVAVVLVVPMMTGSGADDSATMAGVDAALMAAENAADDSASVEESAEMQRDADMPAAGGDAASSVGASDGSADNFADMAAADTAESDDAGAAYDDGGEHCAVPALDAAQKQAIRDVLGSRLERVIPLDGYCGLDGVGGRAALIDSPADILIAVGPAETATSLTAEMPPDRHLALAHGPDGAVVVVYDDQAAALVGDQTLRELAQAVLTSD